VDESTKASISSRLLIYPVALVLVPLLASSIGGQAFEADS